MAKIALLADIHLRSKDFKLKINMLKIFMAQCKEKGVSLICMLGDLFDQGRIGDKNIYADQVVSELEKVWNTTIPIIALEGNHDMVGISSSAFDFIHFQNFVGVRNAVKHFKFKDFDLALIPWLRNNPDYSQYVLGELNKFKPTTKNRILLGHLNIIGCALNKHGYCTPDHYFSFNIEHLLGTQFQPNFGFYGHVHTTQELAPNHRYAGSFAQLRFGEDEANPAGYWLFDTDTSSYEFIDLSYCAPIFKTIAEEEYERYKDPRFFVRFPTEFPEKYKGLPNVKPMTVFKAPVETESFYAQAKSDSINIAQLTTKYCEVKKLQQPTSEFYLSELKELSLNLVKSQTGLDLVNNLTLKGVGVHDHLSVDFKPGLNCIIGRNGAGKTTLIESIYASIYEAFPERGNIKNYMKKNSTVSLNVDSKGKNYTICKTLINKRFISHLNDEMYELVSQFKDRVYPIFGDPNMFSKLVFMDQNNRFDLVTAPDSKRLEILRNLLNLSTFDEKQEQYKIQMSEQQYKFKIISDKTNELETYKEQYKSLAIKEIQYHPSFLHSWRVELDKLLKAEKAKKDLDLYFSAQDEIAKFNHKYPDPQYWLQQKEEYKKLKSELEIFNSWEKIGCKDNPLPCLFLNKLQKSELENIQVKLDAFDTQGLGEFLDDYYRCQDLQKRYPNNKSLNVEIPNNLEEKIEEAREKILELKTQEVRWEESEKTKKIQQFLKGKIEELELYLAENKTEEIEQKILDLKFLIDLCGKSGLSLFIIDVIKDELQVIINDLIEFSELPIKVTLSTNKTKDLDSFKILFSDQEYDVNLASGGEIGLVRTLFKLAIMVYLNRYFGNYKVLILDEPTAALDDENTEAVCNILRKLKYQFNQIILVTHSDKLANVCDHKVILGLCDEYFLQDDQ